MGIVNRSKWQPLSWAGSDYEAQLVDLAFASPNLTDAELTAALVRLGCEAQVRVRHIMITVSTDATPTDREILRRQAEAIRARVVDGEDFAALARQYCADPIARQYDGDLGFFSRGRMVASFEQAAFALEPGHISAVVETPFGYHVIQMEERRTIESQVATFREFFSDRANREALKQHMGRRSERADSNSAQVVSAPGARLLWLADFLFSRKSFEEILKPTVDDMREEYFGALSQSRTVKARWVRIRGTWSFLSAALCVIVASVGEAVVRAWKLLH